MSKNNLLRNGFELPPLFEFVNCRREDLDIFSEPKEMGSKGTPMFLHLHDLDILPLHKKNPYILILASLFLLKTGSLFFSFLIL